MGAIGNKEIFSSNLQKYMDNNDISVAGLSDALKIPYTTVSDWVKAVSYPRIDKIELMANYFGVSKSDLIEQQKKPPTEARSLTKQKIMALIDRLTDEGAERVLGAIVLDFPEELKDALK